MLCQRSSYAASAAQARPASLHHLLQPHVYYSATPFPTLSFSKTLPAKQMPNAIRPRLYMRARDVLLFPPNMSPLPFRDFCLHPYFSKPVGILLKIVLQCRFSLTLSLCAAWCALSISVQRSHSLATHTHAVHSQRLHAYWLCNDGRATYGWQCTLSGMQGRG